MADNANASTAPAGDTTTGQTTPDTAGQDEGKTFTQADLDRVVQERLAREKAKFSDYDQLKAAADELQQIRDGEKSEAQKAIERAEAPEREAETLRQANLRATVAADEGVPSSLLTGKTEDELRASAKALLEFRGIQATGPRSDALRDFNQQPVKGSTAEQFGTFLSDLF